MPFDKLRSTRRWLDVALGSFGGCEDGVEIRRLRLAVRLTGGQSKVGEATVDVVSIEMAAASASVAAATC